MSSKVFVITGPSGVGKGTLIRELLARCPNLELSISATTRQPRAGEEDGREYHFLSPEQFEARVEEKDFLEFATYSGNRYGTLRSEVERRIEAGHSVVLEIEVQGATQVRAAKPDSIQIFIAPPDPAVLRERLAGRGTDSAEAIDRRLETAEIELASQADFDYRVVNDELETATEELVAIVRKEPRHGPAELIIYTPPPMIKPRVDKLLEHSDSHYAAVVVSAKRARQINSYFHNLGEGGFGEYPPPMVETNAEGNYLTMALEELAEGKLKYEYRS